MDLLGLLMPQRCPVCGEYGTPLCAGCRTGLRRLRAPLCARCGASTAWPVERCRECGGRRIAFASARAAVAYDHGARALVNAWKERGIRLLAAAAAEVVAEVVPPPPVHGLVYVPPDGLRVLRRGHNPARELALQLGERWRLPVGDVLVRRGRSERQRGLDRTARRRNVARAFRTRRNAALPARLCLVDDVYTTGATVSAAASALRAAGAREVHVVAFARAIRLTS